MQSLRSRAIWSWPCIQRCLRLFQRCTCQHTCSARAIVRWVGSRIKACGWPSWCVRACAVRNFSGITPDEIPPDGCELAKRVAWGFKRKPPLVVANQTVWYFWLVHERPLSRRARTPGSPKGSRDGDPCRSTILRQIASLLAGTMCRGLISTHAGTHTYTHVYVYV